MRPPSQSQTKIISAKIKMRQPLQGVHCFPQAGARRSARGCDGASLGVKKAGSDQARMNSTDSCGDSRPGWLALQVSAEGRSSFVWRTAGGLSPQSNLKRRRALPRQRLLHIRERISHYRHRRGILPQLQRHNLVERVGRCVVIVKISSPIFHDAQSRYPGF
jgi:hypothetical protein